MSWGTTWASITIGYTERPGGLTNTPFPYSYGYVNQRAFEPGAPRSSRWMTLMSYHNQCGDADISCTRLLRFSNPEMTWRDDPMGIAGDRPSTEVTGPSGPPAGTLDETRMTRRQLPQEQRPNRQMHVRDDAGAPVRRVGRRHVLDRRHDAAGLFLDGEVRRGSS